MTNDIPARRPRENRCLIPPARRRASKVKSSAVERVKWQR